jgi:hypothetical protein
VYAAVAPRAGSGEFIGPDGFAQLRGHPTRVEPAASARDPASAARLWTVSQALTGVRFLDD